jgi:hypothetical protein
MPKSTLACLEKSLSLGFKDTPEFKSIVERSRKE